MKNGDYIRAMDNDRLSRFLWTWELNALTNFMQYGGQRSMNGSQLRKWLESENFVCPETEVGEDFVYDQEFNLKES